MFHHKAMVKWLVLVRGVINVWGINSSQEGVKITAALGSSLKSFSVFPYFPCTLLKTPGTVVKPIRGGSAFPFTCLKVCIMYLKEGLNFLNIL